MPLQLEERVTVSVYLSINLSISLCRCVGETLEKKKKPWKRVKLPAGDGELMLY